MSGRQPAPRGHDDGVSTTRPQPIGERALARWCRDHLAAAPRSCFLDTGHLSSVLGVELDDGRHVVIKARPPSDRLLACTMVQAGMFTKGFPCAEVVAGPASLGRRVATAETYVPGDDSPPAPVPPESTAQLLAALVTLAPSPDAFPALRATLPWVGWDHDGSGLWPPPDDLTVDLNTAVSPPGIDDAARRIRRRLAEPCDDDVLGHLDWEARNLAWRDGEPVAVHDWDSLGVKPESTVVGAAAAVFPSSADVVTASIAETEAFLDAYARHRPLSAAQREQAWAAGAWVLTFNAKKESCGGGTGYLTVVEHELEERLRRSGA